MITLTELLMVAALIISIVVPIQLAMWNQLNARIGSLENGFIQHLQNGINYKNNKPYFTKLFSIKKKKEMS